MYTYNIIYRNGNEFGREFGMQNGTRGESAHGSLFSVKPKIQEGNQFGSWREKFNGGFGFNETKSGETVEKTVKLGNGGILAIWQHRRKRRGLILPSRGFARSLFTFPCHSHPSTLHYTSPLCITPHPVFRVPKRSNFSQNIP